MNSPVNIDEAPLAETPAARRRSMKALALVASAGPAIVSLGLSSSVARAQTGSKRPITLVVPFAAGGGTDSIARGLAKNLSERLGQGVIVDNKGGGGGSIGAQAVAKAAPDGHTLLLATSTFVTNAAAGSEVSYDVEKDFTAVALMGRGPLMVVTSKQLGARNITDLRALAQARPGGLDYCSAGIGSINHLAAEWFRQKAQVRLTHVPYKGSGPATIDLIAGRVQLFFATVPTILPFVRDGRVDLLAVTGQQRLAMYPKVPTMIEAGVEGFDINTWWGVLAPAATPRPVVTALNQAINEAAAGEGVRDRLLSEGAQILRGPPADFQRNLSMELRLWRKVVSSAGIKL